MTYIRNGMVGCKFLDQFSRVGLGKIRTWALEMGFLSKEKQPQYSLKVKKSQTIYFVKEKVNRDFHLDRLCKISIFLFSDRLVIFSQLLFYSSQ